MNAILGALKSKTIWFSVATILLGALVAPVQAWISAHPGLAATVVGAMFAALRGMTSTSLSEKGAPPSG